jgi:carbamoyl-phosphate synthase small subunit
MSILKKQVAILALADGTVFHGKSLGCSGETVGEIVFNTAMTGYQEMITDPSYAHQIITLSYPHVGNTGCNSEDNECSDKVWAAGLVVRDVPLTWSNWRGTQSLQEFLEQKNIIGISDIDTRHLIHHLRDHGAQAACITTVSTAEEAVKKARAFPNMEGLDLAEMVSVKESYAFCEKGGGEPSEAGDFPSYNIIAYDFGIKKNILNILASLGCKITIVPARTSAEDVLAQKPDGIFLSNGPGDPKMCDYAITAIQTFMEKEIPLFGICLGFQLMALAAGASTYKMKFGHHGANHPVSCLSLVDNQSKVMITSQNHGFAVDETTLPEDFHVTHRSLFDSSLQGIRHKKKPFFGFQGHPEASPGPHDATHLFNEFIIAMRKQNNE